MDRTALARATDSTDSPTPGYLFIDIAKSVASSPKALVETVQYLQKRLSGTRNANIKFKCLKVIAKVSEHASTRGQFKRQVCQTTELVVAIKEAVQFRGVPDPVRGDAPYERVREAAKECLSAIYADSPAPSEHQPTPASTNYGVGAAGYATGSSTTKMQGIGNPMYSDPRMQHPSSSSLHQKIGTMTIGEVVGTVGETMKNMIKDPLARNIPDSAGTMPIPGMPGHGSGQYSYPPGRNELSEATKGQWTMASNRGPNAIGRSANDTNESYYKPKDSSFSWAQQSASSTASRGGVGGSWGATAGGGVAAAAREAPVSNVVKTPYITPTTAAPAYGGAGGTALTDGSYERNLIAELCPPGGIKAEPPMEKLEQFARNLPTLNPDYICPALLDNLEDGSPWIVRAKALCVIEKTIQVPMDPNPYADFFHTCAAEIEPLTSHSRSAIRDPAKRVLKELGLELPEDAPPSFAVPPPSSNAAPAPEADLLDFGCGDEPAPLAPPPAAAPPIVVSPLRDSSSSAPPQSSSLFGGLTVVATAPSVPSPPETDGNLLMFGGDTPKNESTAETTSVSNASDLFSNMSVKENTASNIPEASDASSGSAFSFINTPQPSAAVSPGKETFDPLLSSDWSSTSKPQSNNVNAKMQALASYQANLMMMQNMQMQQLMMQQQQAKIGFPVAPNPQLAMMHNSNPAVMQANSMRQIPILGQDPKSNAFSFLRDDVSEKRKHEQQSFDFIKDAMKTAK